MNSTGLAPSALPVVMTGPGRAPSYLCTGLAVMRCQEGARERWLAGREIAAGEGSRSPLRLVAGGRR